MNTPPLAGILAVLLIVGAFGAGAAGAVALQPPTAAVAGAALYPQKLLLSPDALEAHAAVLYDATTGTVLFEKNAQEQLPLASLTKLMSAYAVLSVRDPRTVVTITPADLEPYGDWGLMPGDHMSLRDLLRLGLVASSNDAMAAAVASLGSDYLSAMNEAATTLNLTKTYFLNPTGLDLDDDTSGAYGSAYDIARLAAAFYKAFPGYLELSGKPSVEVVVGERTISADATMTALQNMPGFIGAKTGYTDLAGGNVAAVFDLEVGHPVVAVVLRSSEEGRFKDIRTLIDALRQTQTDGK